MSLWKMLDLLDEDFKLAIIKMFKKPNRVLYQI